MIANNNIHEKNAGCYHNYAAEKRALITFARFNDRIGLAVEVECDSAVSEGIHQILRL